jgi:uncharacterized Zn finger protein
MRITDISCEECGASYEIAESATVSGSAGRADCGACGTLLAKWSDGQLKAFRMVVQPLCDDKKTFASIQPRL